ESPAFNSLSGHIDMSEALRKMIFEKHGPELGGILYEAEVARRDRIAKRYAEQTAALQVANAALEAKSAELAPNLIPLRAAMEEAYAVWLRATEALEAQRVANEAKLSPFTQRIAELVTEINTPAFADRVTQWGRPDWFRPEIELPPMPRNE
ncbi:MAG TPA: hypothetical protein VGM99_02920, partial [Candidatus Cybelea sp.]